MKRMVTGILILLVLSQFAVWKGFAQMPQVRTTIDTTQILIGDQINVLFELEVKPDDQIQFPVFRDTLMRNLEILSVSSVDSQLLDNGLKQLRQRLLITSFDTGFYIIPSLAFFHVQAAETLRSEALPLEVLTLEVDTSQGITDIKLPYEVPLTFWELLPYLVVGLLLAGIVVGLWLLWKKKKTSPTEIVRPKPLEPPHIWALRELDQIAAQKLWQQGKVKLFHSRVSEVLRSYMEFRFDIPALEQTTSEIIFALDETDFIDPDLLENLHQSMEISDLVKFAKWAPLPDENEKVIEMAYEFVYKTKKVVNLRESDPEQEKQIEKGNDHVE